MSWSWIKNLPTWIKYCFVIGGPLLTNFSSELPTQIKTLGLILGVIICLIGIIGILLGAINKVNRAIHWNKKIIVILVVFISFLIGAIISGFFLYKKVAIQDTEYILKTNSPLTIIKPSSTNPYLIRTYTILPEDFDARTDVNFLYKNYYLVGIENDSREKTIKNVNVRFWHMGKFVNFLIDGSKDTNIDLKPGEIIFFRIAYAYSYTLKNISGKQEIISREIFKNLYLNTSNKALIFEHEVPHIVPLNLPNDPAFLSTRYVFQLSADDIPSQYFRVIINRDATIEPGFFFEVKQAKGPNDDGIQEILAKK